MKCRNPLPPLELEEQREKFGLLKLRSSEEGSWWARDWTPEKWAQPGWCWVPLRGCDESGSQGVKQVGGWDQLLMTGWRAITAEVMLIGAVSKQKGTGLFSLLLPSTLPQWLLLIAATRKSVGKGGRLQNHKSHITNQASGRVNMEGNDNSLLSSTRRN